jgi:hypothetical protein
MPGGVGSGVPVGFGVFVGSGVEAGTGVLVGDGIAVGTRVAIGSGVAVADSEEQPISNASSRERAMKALELDIGGVFT